jgi:hypothetical protein
LARRLRDSSEAEPALREPLAEICAEFEAERAALESLMDRLEVRRNRVKSATAWAGERLGRLKSNGRLRGYSPLSRLVELEGLYIGISGKLRMWRVLAQTQGEGPGGIDFAHFAEMAEHQRRRVEELHGQAAERAFPGG